MKKYFFFLFVFSAFYIKLSAQEYKRNANWTTGQNPVVNFNFNASLVITSLPNTNSGIKSSSSAISDTDGNLLLFSNGFIAYNYLGDAVDSGEYINCPYGKVLCNYYGGASLFDQTSIILPKKGNTYYVFSTGMSDSVATNYLNQVKAEFDVLNYSVVDMDSNNGKGKVVQKNVVLADKQHYSNSAMHAVKHANGKDWWLVKADCSNNRYVEYIVREDTILGPFYQQANDSLNNAFCIGSFSVQLYFNEQGTQMASGIYGTMKPNNFYDFNRVDLYDFDRCDGKLVFKKYYEVPYDTATYPNNDYKSGICFSPDGKLLYMSNSYTIYQIDLTDTNTYNAILISGPDTNNLSYFPTYSTMAVAPDGKLYIGNWNGIRKYMSYIANPNVKGSGCNFVANGVWQPYTNLRTPPNMPNYGLGADSVLLIGCAPVGLQTTNFIADTKWVLYPNPCSNRLYVKHADHKKKELFNSVGQLIFSTSNNELDVSSLAKGFYYLRCENQIEKVVIE